MNKQLRKKYDWAQIRHEYVTSLDGPNEVTLESLCRKYGCSERHIKRISAREGWIKLREGLRAQASAKAQATASETAAQRLTRHARIMQVIQSKGVKAIQEEGIVPSPRDTIEAAKTERLIFGEPDSRPEITGGIASDLTPEQRIAIYKILEDKNEDKRTEDKG